MIRQVLSGRSATTELVRDLAAKVSAALAIQFKLLSRVDVEVAGAVLVAPQQSVALFEALRRTLAEPPAAV